jgi:uncharacterized membrane protein YbhN (UPF0104 family)
VNIPFLRSRTNRTQLLRIAGTILALGLVIYLFAKQGWGDIEAAFRSISIWRLVLAMILMIISRFAVTGRWHVLLRSSGLNITFGESARITFAGLFSNNFLPTTIGGDVIRLAGAVQFKYDAAICGASLIVDRLVGMAGMAMAVPFGLPSLLGSQAIRGAGLSVSSTIQSGATVLSLNRFWRKIFEAGSRIARKIIIALTLWVKKPRSLLVALSLSWIHMLCFFAILFLLLDGMQEKVPFWLVAGLYSYVYFVTLLPISINGYGVQELILAFIFSRFAGVSWANGLITALLFRTLQMIASLPGAAFVPGIMAGIRAHPIPEPLSSIDD